MKEGAFLRSSDCTCRACAEHREVHLPNFGRMNDHHCALRSFFLSLASEFEFEFSIIRPLALDRSTVARVSAVDLNRKKLSFIRIDPLGGRGEKFSNGVPLS